MKFFPNANHNFVWIVIVLGMLAAQSALALDDRVAIVGLDQEGRSHLEIISTESLRSTFHEVSAAVGDSVFSALRKRNPTQAPDALELRTLAVGVTIKGKAGLGFLWNLAGKARLRFVFSNTNTPVYPE